MYTEIINYLRNYLSENIINIDTVSDEVLLKSYKREVHLIELIVEDMRKTSITWSIEDFEGRAEELIGEDWENFYDKTKFREALESMIKHHDAEYGITWDSVDYYLDSICKKVKDEKE